VTARGGSAVHRGDFDALAVVDEQLLDELIEVGDVSSFVHIERDDVSVYMDGVGATVFEEATSQLVGCRDALTS
jgi:hypothetical protein